MINIVFKSENLFPGRSVSNNFAKKFCCSLVLACLLFSATTRAQVSTYYVFSKSDQAYKSDTSTTSTVPANIFPTIWDDNTYTGYKFPFNFTYNGVLYTGGTSAIGVDSDGWAAFSTTGTITMTGTVGGGSWVSISDHTGVYLNGTANNNGFCGFNSDLQDQTWTTITANTTNGSKTVTNVSDFSNLRVGTRLEGTGITDGTVINTINIAAATFTMSGPATATGTAVTLTPRTSIYAFIRGVAPYRQFVIQWTRMTRYSGAGTGDDFSFQLVLNEGGGNPTYQTLQTVYGVCKATNTVAQNAQVGLRGASSADFNARTTTTNWSATTAAAVNTATCSLTNSVFPNSGLTYTWSPICSVAASAAGAISGPTNVCPGTSVDYSIAGVPGAIFYTWTYTGANTTLSGTTTLPLNTLDFDITATGGTLTVTPGNLCGNGTPSSIVLTMGGLPTASISYSASSYCTSASPASCTITGTPGGTFSASPGGLTINTSTGLITPATSTPGNYVVTYTFTSGCTATATKNITINTGPVVTATATPAVVCSSPNSSQLQATVPVSNYTLASIAYTSLTPSAGSTVLWNTYQLDNISGSIAMPFAFNYYGSPIASFVVATEGYVQLQTGTAVQWTPQTLPNATDPNNIIALAWADLIVDPSSNPGSSVRYFVNGVTPNRILVIDYINLRFLGGTGQNVTGQIRLYESNSHIEIAAGTVDDNGDLWPKTMGIENSTGTLATTPPGRNNLVWNVTNEAWSFTPASNTYSYLWSPGTFLSSTSIANPVATNVSSTTNYTVTVTNTSTGCSGTAPVSISLVGAMSGTYTVGVGGNFTTLTAAVAAYNAGCIGGPIIFSLIDNTYPGETFPITINNNAAASSTNTLTIKPAVSKTPLISGSSATYLIGLKGADYIIFDGSNTVGGTTRDLSITNTAASSNAVLSIISSSASDGATNNTIKNCKVFGGSASGTITCIITGSYITAGNDAEFPNNNNTIQNNLLYKAQNGIYQRGNAASLDQNWLITKNDIGSAVVAEKMGFRGMAIINAQNFTVSNNNIAGVNDGGLTVSNMSGILVAGNINTGTINLNKISDIKHTSVFGAMGIYLGATTTASNITVVNNFIFDIAAEGFNGRTVDDNGYGIAVDFGGGYKIYYNTVNLNTNPETGTNFPSALLVTSGVTTASSISLKNNIFQNTQTVAGQRYSIQCTATNAVFDTINFNGYYTTGANPGYLSGNLGTLAAIQGAFLKNTNSFVPATPAIFKSATDMHIDTTNANNIANWKNKGGAITGFTDDYDLTTRNGYTPDVGADEWVEGKYGSWVGKVSIDWLVPANWEANVVPDRGTDVFVTGGYAFMPTIVTTQAIRSLALSAPVPANTPVLTLSGGTLQVYNTMSTTGGTIDGINGTLETDSTVATTIPANLFTSNALKNLVINNSGGLTLGGLLDIYRSVTFGSSGASLTTNSNLTFKSTATETAWLGNVTGKTFTGTVTIERYIPTGINHNKTWQLLAFPIKSNTNLKVSWMENNASLANAKPGYGTTISSEVAGAVARGYDFYTPVSGTAGGPSLKTYVPATGTWVGVDNGVALTNATAMAPQKKGYFIFVRGDRSVQTFGAAAVPTVLRASGTPYTTGANAPPTTTVLAGKFETIGNPYPSAIDFTQVGRAAGVDNVFYVWDPKLPGSKGLGGYQTISGVTGYLPTPGSTTYPSGTPMTTIQSGLAFFVHGTAGGNVTFSEAAKVSGSSLVVKTAPPNLHLLKLNLYKVSTFDLGPVDGNIVAFDNNYSNSFEKKDALKIQNSSENIGIVSNQQLLAVEARKPVNRHDTIFYSIGGVVYDNYRLGFAPQGLSFPHLSAFLVDNFLHTMTPVSLTDSTFIDFSITPEEASYAADRFYLVFNRTPINPVNFARTQVNHTSEPEKNIPAINVYPNPVVNKTLFVSFVNQLPGNYQVQLFNKLGQPVLSKTIQVNSINTIGSITLNAEIAAGTYQVIIIGEDGKKTTQQLVVK